MVGERRQFSVQSEADRSSGESNESGNYTFFPFEPGWLALNGFTHHLWPVYCRFPLFFTRKYLMLLASNFQAT